MKGCKVMLDVDLAELYGIETKRFNEQVKRNSDRYPDDFMFILDSRELADLRSQIATLEGLSRCNYVFKHPPRLFTELGVVVLSSVINTPISISVNIVIMRTLKKLEKGTNELFQVVFDRMETIEEIVFPNISPNRKK